MVAALPKIRPRQVISNESFLSKNRFGKVSNKNEAANFFKGSFEGLLEDGQIYRDIAGYHVPGGVNLSKKIYERVEPGLKAFQEMARRSTSLQDCVAAYKKAIAEHEGEKVLLSSSWDIPIHALPGVNAVTPGILPIQNLMARMATDKDTVVTTPMTDTGAAAHVAENASSYTENDDTFDAANYSFPIAIYGRQNKVSDLMNLVGNAIANPKQVLAFAQTLAIRRFEEIQIIMGQNSPGSASSFKGLTDFATTASNTTNKSAGLSYPDDLDDLVEQVVDDGGNPETMAIFTDTTTHRKIKKALRNYVRTDSPFKTFAGNDLPNGINFRYRVLDFDGIPIFKTYGSPDSNGARRITCVDMASFAMAMVQDATLKPLAKAGPYELAATDAMGTLVSWAHPHVAQYTHIT